MTPRQVDEEVNPGCWGLVASPIRLLPDGSRRDPYMQSGCHPDCVERVWDRLGGALGEDYRARAGDIPVLATLHSGRVFAAAHGTRYLIWLTRDDLADALAGEYSTRMQWSAPGHVTDTAEVAEPGWVWGRWRTEEVLWLRRSIAALDEHAPDEPG